MAIGLELFNTAVTNLNFGSLQVEKVDFGSINVWNNVSDNALTLFREGVPAIDNLSFTGYSGGEFDTALELNDGGIAADGSTPLADIFRFRDGFTNPTFFFLRDRTPVGSFALLWVDDQNFALYEVDSHRFGFDSFDEVSIEAMVAVGTTGTGANGGELYVFADTVAFLRSVIEINGVWQPRDVVANALDLFRAGVPAIDTHTFTSLRNGGGSGIRSELPSFQVINSDGSSLLSDIVAFGAEASFPYVPANDPSYDFFDMRVPVNSYILVWVNDQNFALYQVNSVQEQFFDETYDVTIEIMIAVGTTGTAGAEIYVFADTTGFLASVIEINGVWQPRPAGEFSVGVTRTFTINYNHFFGDGVNVLVANWPTGVGFFTLTEAFPDGLRLDPVPVNPLVENSSIERISTSPGVGVADSFSGAIAIRDEILSESASSLQWAGDFGTLNVTAVDNNVIVAQTVTLNTDRFLISPNSRRISNIGPQVYIGSKPTPTVADLKQVRFRLADLTNLSQVISIAGINTPDVNTYREPTLNDVSIRENGQVMRFSGLPVSGDKYSEATFFSRNPGRTNFTLDEFLDDYVVFFNTVAGASLLRYRNESNTVIQTDIIGSGMVLSRIGNVFMYDLTAFSVETFTLNSLSTLGLFVRSSDQMTFTDSEGVDQTPAWVHDEIKIS